MKPVQIATVLFAGAALTGCAMPAFHSYDRAEDVPATAENANLPVCGQGMLRESLTVASCRLPIKIENPLHPAP